MKPGMSYRKLQVWDKSRELAVFVYKQTDELRDYGFRDQLRRAAISISNNIAEGAERGSNKDFGRFLSIAKGSAAEVSSMAVIGLDLDYFDSAVSETLESEAISIMKMLASLIRTLETSNSKPVTRN